jgi:stearoyl-CoA desaturase (delta-9 desaturase)
MKIFELDNKKLILLTIISHACLLLVFFAGTFLQIISTISVSIAITLFASTVTYHRLLSHRSWKAPRWFEIFGSVLGVFSFTGSTISRTAVHRMHHAFVDTEKDPHSPKHVGRLFVYFPVKNNNNISPKLVSDLLRDPLHKNIHKYYLLIVTIVFLLAVEAFGLFWAVSLIIAPGALCWVSTALLNMYGHSLDGTATNSKLLSLATFGEGNHKFHHEFPTEANIGQGSFDPGYAVIKFLEKK